MKKNLNIDSTEWCDVVFQNKNKSYGAYRLRQSSSKRHIAAFVSVVAFMAVVMAIPNLVSAVKDMRNANAPMEEIFTMSEIPLEQQLPEENIVREEQAPPPPPLKSTVKFTPPIITAASEVNDEDEMKAVSTILDSKLQVSMMDVKGTDEQFGLDIAEIEQHKIIVEDVRPKGPIEIAEQMPQFLGGESELNAFISKNLKYPISAQENGIQGRVTIRFVVTSTGAIADVKVMRGIDPACDKEAVRVVKSMPKWVPGKQNGNNVAVYFTLPIVFRLNN